VSPQIIVSMTALAITAACASPLDESLGVAESVVSGIQCGEAS
jgi:hypothetical protein